MNADEHGIGHLAVLAGRCFESSLRCMDFLETDDPESLRDTLEAMADDLEELAVRLEGRAG